MRTPSVFDKSHLRRAVAVAVVALVAVSLAGSASAQSAANATPVDSCTTIDRPGSYVVTEDVAGTVPNENAACIEITASNVVLDGAGHTLSGNGSGHGVEVNGTAKSVSNVTVERLHSEDWSIGVFFLGAENGTVRNTVTNDSTEGVALAAASGNRVIGATAYDNAIGVAIGGDSHNNTVRNALAVRNKWGIHFERESGANTVVDSVARNNSKWEYYSMRNDAANTVRGLELSTGTFSFTGQNVALRAVRSPPAIPNGTGNLDSFVRVYDTAGASSLSLTMEYGSASANAVSLWRTTGDDWSRVRGATTDASANSVSVENTTRFGTFAVLADSGTGGPVTVTTSQPPSVQRTLTTTPASTATRTETSVRSTTTAAVDTAAPTTESDANASTTKSPPPTTAAVSPANGTATTATQNGSGAVGGFVPSTIGWVKLAFAVLGLLALFGIGLTAVRDRGGRNDGF